MASQEIKKDIYETSLIFFDIYLVFSNYKTLEASILIQKQILIKLTFIVQSWIITLMDRRSKKNYEYLANMENQLSENISELKTISKGINSQLKTEQATRQTLEQYLESGLDALKKTNEVIKDILKEKSIFGCNVCILFGIALIVILILTIF